MKRKELVLARNKVTAGHSQKMRESKCLKNKSEVDMAAIFGTKLPKRNNKEQDDNGVVVETSSRERKRQKKQDSCTVRT
jgi:hypothetical protein